MCESIFLSVQQYSKYKKTLDPCAKTWQIGLTRVFMKEAVKVALEGAKSVAVLDQAKHIQKLWRGHKARKLFKAMLEAAAVIKMYIWRYALRKRFRNIVVYVVNAMRKAIRQL